MYLIILLTMIFCHIVDDYYLQGILANMKQKQWWKDGISNFKYRRNYDFYKHDYIVALITHGFSWSFMINLPILWRAWNVEIMDSIFACIFVVFVLFHAVIHAVIDNLKANKFKLNLLQDQLLHLIQIISIWVMYYTVLN